jgi:nitrous oxidase accessory protein
LILDISEEIMREISLSTAFLLLMSVLLFIWVIPTENAIATTRFVGGVGPGNYTAIQNAIDDANSGDVIFVYSGTYVGRIVVNKTVTILGEDWDTTIVEGDGGGDVVVVSADWVNISGLMVRNSGIGGESSAIELLDVENCRITGNKVLDNEIGISTVQTNETFVGGNLASNNSIDIRSISSRNITMEQNMMTGGGVYLWGSSLEDWNTHNIDGSNTVNGDPVRYCSNEEQGSIVSSMSQIILANCSGMLVQGQRINGVAVGIHLGFSSGNIIRETNVSANQYGIRLDYSDGNLITNSTLSFNEIIETVIISSDNNTMANNTCWSDTTCVFVTGSSIDNRIFNNNFFSNGISGFDAGNLNLWHNGYPSAGNYWMNYTGSDIKSGPNQDQAGGDGIGDTPYILAGIGNTDEYPLMGPVQFPPSSPGNLRTTAYDQRVVLEWDPPAFDGFSPVTNYRVYRGISSGSGTFLTELGNVLNYEDTGLTNAVNSIDEGPKSNEAEATPTSSTPNQPPTCIIQAPIQGELISDTYLVFGTASDSDGMIQLVQVRINLGSWIQAVGSDSWSYLWNTTTLDDGPNTLEVRCYDGVDYSAVTNVSVQVDNSIGSQNEPPTCQILNPSSGLEVQGNVNISGSASDSDGEVVFVEVSIDGGNWRTAQGTDTWAYLWDSSDVSNGDHTISARSFDGSIYSITSNVTIVTRNDDTPDDNLVVFLISLVIFCAVLAIIIILYLKKRRGERQKPSELDEEQ